MVAVEIFSKSTSLNLLCKSSFIYNFIKNSLIDIYENKLIKV